MLALVYGNYFNVLAVRVGEANFWLSGQAVSKTNFLAVLTTYYFSHLMMTNKIKYVLLIRKYINSSVTDKFSWPSYNIWYINVLTKCNEKDARHHKGTIW